MKLKGKGGVGSHEGSGTGIESCKDSTLFLLCLACISLEIFDFLSSRWNLEALQPPNLLCDSFSHTEVYVLVSPKEVGGSSSRWSFLSQSAIV